MLACSKIDKIGMDVVSQEEFRAAIESRFDLEMTDDQFRSLVDHVPLDEEGNVRYADFMAQFDTRCVHRASGAREREVFGHSDWSCAPFVKGLRL